MFKDTLLIDSNNFLELIFRFGLNTTVLVLLVKTIYYDVARRKDYLFTYMLIGTIIFLLCYLLESVKLQLGFALGLFALFGIIRYRTDQIPIKEMTYFFLVIGLAVINALANNTISLIEILFSNFMIVIFVWLLEKRLLLNHEQVKEILYDKIDLIKPSMKAELIRELEERTGIYTITRVEIQTVDFLRDTCRLKLFYVDRNVKSMPIKFLK